jgi:hypothetical protein
MQGLSENIERFIESIQHSGSFLTQFLNGFMRGISRSKVFREALHDMAAALRSVYKFGIKVGEAFAVAFPGFEGMIKAIGTFVRQITEASEKGESSVKGFFEAFSTAAGAKQKITELFNFLTGQGSIAGASLTEFNEHYNTFLTAIANGIEALIPMIADEMVKAINELTTNLQAGFDAVSSETNKKANPLVRIFGSLIQGLFKVLPSLVSLFSAIMWKLFTDPETRGTMIAGSALLFAWIASPFVIQVLSSILTKVLWQAIKMAFTGGGGTAAAAEATAAATGGGGFLASIGGAISTAFSSIVAVVTSWPVIFGLVFYAIGRTFKAFQKDIENFFVNITGGAEIFGIKWSDIILNSIIYPFISFYDGIRGILSGIMLAFDGTFTWIKGLVLGDSSLVQQGLYDMLAGLYNFVLGLGDAVTASIPLVGAAWRK